MPFKSEAQRKWMYSAEERGELPKGTAKRWAKHTPNIKDLPEHVKKAAFAKIALILKKLQPVPSAFIEQKEAQQAAAMSRKGMSPAASRAHKSAKVT